MEELNEYTAQKLYDNFPKLRGRITFWWTNDYEDYLTMHLRYRGRVRAWSVPIHADSAHEGVADEAIHQVIAAFREAGLL